MKFTKIALALAALAAAQNASAFDVYLSGASALRSTVGDITNRICQPSTRVQYGTGNTRLYKCTLHTDATFAAANPTFTTTATDELGSLVGKPMNLFHSVVPGATFTNSDNLVGGSVTGVLPLLPNASASLVKFCNDVSTNTTCSATTFQAPHMGFSDVEANKYTTDFGNLPTDATAIANGWVVQPGDNPAALTQAVSFVQGFGIGVTANAQAQGVTNLSMEQLGEVLAGNIFSTDQLVTTTSGLNIRVCRRTDGSGTQATFNALASRKGCGANVLGFAYTVADKSNPQVTESAATSGVVTCLNNAQANGEAGVGILSLENVSQVNANWSFIAVNGVNAYDATETNDATAADGKGDKIREDRIASNAYPLWVESVIIKSAKATLNADQEAFYTYLATNAGKPVFTSRYPGVVSLPAYRAEGFSTNFSRSGDSCTPAGYTF